MKLQVIALNRGLVSSALLREKAVPARHWRRSARQSLDLDCTHRSFQLSASTSVKLRRICAVCSYREDSGVVVFFDEADALWQAAAN